MTKIELLENLIDEIEELSTIDEVKSLLNAYLEDAIILHERKMMSSSDSLYDIDDDSDDTF